MRKTGNIILIVTVVAICIVTASACLFLDDATKGLIGYYAWKTFSRNSGGGHYADVNRIRIYYELHGNGEPLLLLHGGTAFIESLYAQIPEFASRFWVIAPDSRAHGRSSDNGDPLSYGRMASDMAELLKILNVRQAYVVGWSDGGIIGLDLAIHRPDLVRKLVMIGTNYHYNGMTPEAVSFTETLSPETSELAGIRSFYGMIAPDPAKWPVLIGRIREMWRTQPEFSENELRTIRKPVLVLVGEHDMIRTDHSRRMAELILNSKLVIVPGASHGLPMERPDFVNPLIINFLLKEK